MFKRNISFLIAIFFSLPLTTFADTAIFELGEVLVTAPKVESNSSTVQTVDQEHMRQFNRETVARALNILPGITVTEGGPRNEQMMTLRGFDLRQVPVFVDGIPVYVSYDGYVDLGRFNTFDLATINVSKSFSSVLFGPNTLGGAINLVSRKPVKKLEGDITAGAYFNQSGINGFHGDVNAGGNHGVWYWQASASELKKDSYNLSNDFTATKYQDVGARNNAYTSDQKINLKLGWMPREGDEYTLNYINQQGAKGTPPYAGSDTASTNSARFWQWPYWNKESLYYISRTGIGSDAYLKLRAFYDKFKNSITNYTDNTYSVLKAMPFYQSWYDDYSYGASAEFGSKIMADNTFKAAAHFKDDVHREHNQGNPIQNFKDRTTSIGLEDTQSIGNKLNVVTGISYDARDTLQAENYLANTIVDFQKGSTNALNPQIGLFYQLTEKEEMHATLSRKSRFPTIKDRYSYRLGTAIPNADLKAERSTSYELGGSSLLGRSTHLNAAVFYYDTGDMIQGIAITPVTLCGATATVCTQMQNIGVVHTTGGEIGVTTALASTLDWGVNYTNLKRENISNPAIQLTDVPREKLFTHIKWQASDALTLLGNIEANSSRISSTDGSRIAAGFGVANIKATYKFTSAWSAEAGINNLLDKNYAVIEGYPMEGRNIFANSTWKF